MSINQFLSIVAARWKVMLTIFLLTVGTTVGISLILPKQYAATSSVLIDIKSPDPIMGMIVPGMLAPSYMATQADVIQSERVARRVVRGLKLVDNPQSRAQWQEATQGKGDIETWFAGALQKSLDVKPSKESNVIAVTYKAVDPRFAAILANAFVQSYIDVSAELRTDPAKLYSTFFDTRSKAAREELERAQTKLSAFQKERGIIANDERFDVENARLNDLSQQIVALQGIAAESGSRQVEARGRTNDQLQEVLNNGLILSLRSDLSRQEARLQELSARYGDNHPQVAEIKANITEMRGRIDAEVRRITGGVSVANRINRQREVESRSAFEAQRNKVLRMKQQRDEGAVLLREVESAQRAYDNAMSRFSQTSLESQNTLTNIAVLSTANEPADPASPKLVLNSLISVILGSALAIGAALLLEFANRRVRTVEDLVQALALPVLGVLPGNASQGSRRNKTQSLLARRVLGQLSGPRSKPV